MTSLRHPIQPLVTDEDGVVRFKQNAIVRFLLDAGPFGLDQLALMPFEREDHEQLAQLIGYSLSGFAELDYVSDETYAAAEASCTTNGARMQLTQAEAEPCATEASPSIVITGLPSCTVETIRHADHVEIKVTVDEPEPEPEKADG